MVHKKLDKKSSPPKSKELIKELREKKEYLSFAMESNMLGTWDWHIQNGLVYFDEDWADMLGFKKSIDNLYHSEKWFSLVHPDDLKQAEKDLEAHFKRKTKHYTGEVRMKHKSGKWIWIMAQGKVFEWDESGNPIRMVGTYLDINDRKGEEEELKKLSEITIGRELRMIELKREVNDLLAQLGEEPKYKIGF